MIRTNTHFAIMKATKKDIQRLAKSLKEDFKKGCYQGNYSDRLEGIVLGYENAFKSDNGSVGIESRGRYFYLWLDTNIK